MAGYFLLVLFLAQADRSQQQRTLQNSVARSGCLSNSRKAKKKTTTKVCFLTSENHENACTIFDS